MGYVMLFAQAFPLAPFLCVISNIIDIQTKIVKLSDYSQRF
jgi:hypothetical protein